MLADLGFWGTVAFAGFAGFGLGLGLVAGAFLVRTVRRFIRGDPDPPEARGGDGATPPPPPRPPQP